MIKNISESPINKRSISLKSYDELVTSDSKLKKKIEDKFLTELFSSNLVSSFLAIGFLTSLTGIILF